MFTKKNTMDEMQAEAGLYPVHYTIDYVGYVDNEVVRVNTILATFSKPLSGTDLSELRFQIQKDHSLDFVAFTSIYRHER